MTNSVDPDEAAHFEPPHQDIHCLKIQRFSSLALKVLNSDLYGLVPFKKGGKNGMLKLLPMKVYPFILMAK